MQKKPVEKAADIKSIVKTTGEKATEKVTETKEIVKEAVKEAVKTAGEKAEETEKKVAEVKSAAKVEESKAAVKVEEAKEAVKKTVKKTAEKTAEKKAVTKKTEFLPEVFVQFGGREDVVADVVERAKEAFVADGHKEAAIKSLQVYLKPEDSTAYYVVNKKYAGKVSLF